MAGVSRQTLDGLIGMTPIKIPEWRDTDGTKCGEGDSHLFQIRVVTVHGCLILIRSASIRLVADDKIEIQWDDYGD
jgi:hypothetical protein